jgi:hypothetical protein
MVIRREHAEPVCVYVAHMHCIRQLRSSSIDPHPHPHEKYLTRRFGLLSPFSVPCPLKLYKYACTLRFSVPCPLKLEEYMQEYIHRRYAQFQPVLKR